MMIIILFFFYKINIHLKKKKLFFAHKLPLTGPKLPLTDPKFL